jgi:hypothetical protein
MGLSKVYSGLFGAYEMTNTNETVQQTNVIDKDKLERVIREELMRITPRPSVTHGEVPRVPTAREQGAINALQWLLRDVLEVSVI